MSRLNVPKRCVIGYCCRWIQYSENRWIGNWSQVGRFPVTGGSLRGVLSFSSNANWAFCFSRSHATGIQPCTNVACMRRILGVLPFPPRADWAFCPFRCTIIGHSAVTAQPRIGRFAVPYSLRDNFEAFKLEIIFLNPRAYWAFCYSAGELVDQQ